MQTSPRNVRDQAPVRRTALSSFLSMHGRLIPAAASIACTLLLAGCGLDAHIASEPLEGAAISGHIHGGQQPVVGAVVTLYAPGTNGYGSTPTPIVSTVSLAGGAFTLPRPYTCPADSGNVYIVATGGDPGLGAVNPAIGLAALLGPCSALTADTTISINEVTTVAAAYALAPFADVTADGTGIGTSANNLLGLNNAAGPATALVNTAAGTANVGVDPSIILPTAEINTLANILAACVNSDGSLTTTSGSTTTAAPCGTLFTLVKPKNGVAPVDTFQAAIQIARHPGHHAHGLFKLATATAPFQPVLSTAPSDFALGIQFAGNAATGPAETTGIDIDANGNAWVTATGGANANPAPNTIPEIRPFAEYVPTIRDGQPDRVAAPSGVAISAAGFIYVADAPSTSSVTRSNLLRINPADNAKAYGRPASLDLNSFLDLAIDNLSSTLWVTNGGPEGNGTTITQAMAGGVDAPGSPYTVPAPSVGLAMDGTGNMWSLDSQVTANDSSGAGYLTQFSPPATAGQPYTVQNFSLGNALFAEDLAFDREGNAWMTAFPDESTHALAKYTPSTATLATYPLNDVTDAIKLVIDGRGRVFANSGYFSFSDPLPGTLTVVSSTGKLISHSGLATSSGSKLLGYAAGGILPNVVSGVRIDASGNVWSTGYNDFAGNPFIVSEVIGVAAPVDTPISVAASTNKLGRRP